MEHKGARLRTPPRVLVLLMLRDATDGSARDSLPPHLAQLQDVHEGLEGPHACSAAPERPAARAHRRRRRVLLRLHRVVVHEPAEAEHLHHGRGQRGEEQREREPPVVAARVVIGREPHVRGAIAEEDEQRAKHPAAIEQRLPPGAVPALFRSREDTTRLGLLVARARGSRAHGGCGGSVRFGGHVCL